jgi:hypothetical protein
LRRPLPSTRIARVSAAAPEPDSAHRFGASEPAPAIVPGWQQVNTIGFRDVGFGNSHDIAVHAILDFTPFNGKLYAGTGRGNASSSGAETMGRSGIRELRPLLGMPTTKRLGTCMSSRISSMTWMLVPRPEAAVGQFSNTVMGSCESMQTLNFPPFSAPSSSAGLTQLHDRCRPF